MIKLKQILSENTSPKTIFFSHPRITYNTPLEKYWMKKIKRKFKFAKIENPNTSYWITQFFKYGEKAYLDLIERSIITIGLPITSTELTDGVAQELIHSLKIGIPTYVIIDNTLKRILNLNSFKILSNSETEERLHKQGIYNLDNPIIN